MTTGRRKDNKRRGAATRNELRIIGGRWRSRRIVFPDHAGLRPTPDRVRETLFNWLQPVIAGAKCLDLFAGSGVLGCEALSRGAESVTFVERDAAVCEQIRATLRLLDATNAEVICADALTWLTQGTKQPYDIVFIDPPYASDSLARTCRLLDEQGWLGPNAYIYAEAQADDMLTFLPARWRLTRSNRAGQVGYHLARLHST